MTAVIGSPRPLILYSVVELAEKINKCVACSAVRYSSLADSYSVVTSNNDDDDCVRDD